MLSYPSLPKSAGELFIKVVETGRKPNSRAKSLRGGKIGIGYDKFRDKAPW